MAKKKTVKRSRSVRQLSRFERQFIDLHRVFVALGETDIRAAELTIYVLQSRDTAT